MKPGRIRFGAIVLLLGFLLVFFAPIVYDATPFACHRPPGGGFSFSLCLSNPAGLESIGYAIAGWGATYGFEAGYNGPIVLWGMTVLTTMAVLVFIALPVAAAVLFLMLPELVRIVAVLKSRFLHGSG